MSISDTAHELEGLLREYNDDNDFVEGVLYEASTDEDMDTMIRFINTARESYGNNITQDELILLSIALAEKRKKAAAN